MSVIQQNLDKLTVTAGVATGAKTSTATSSAIDFLEFDGDILLVKEERVNGNDGSLEEAFKYYAHRFNNENFNLYDPEIILDSLLDI